MKKRSDGKTKSADLNLEQMLQTEQNEDPEEAKSKPLVLPTIYKSLSSKISRESLKMSNTEVNEDPQSETDFPERLSIDAGDLNTLFRIIQLREVDDMEYKTRISIDSKFEKCSSICRDEKCLKTEFRLPAIKPNQKREKEWDIKALCDIMPFEKQEVKSVREVSSKRKERHEAHLKEMQNEMNKINRFVENEIRKYANNLILQIKIIKDNIEFTIQKIEENESQLTQEIISKLHDAIYDLNLNRIYKIEIYNDILLKLEKQRTDKFKDILQKTYNAIRVISYLLPLEVQQFFQEKITHINQVTLSNYHAYTELEGKLKLQMEEDMKDWFQKIEYLRTTKQSQLSNTTTLTIDESVEEPHAENFQSDLQSKLEMIQRSFKHLQYMMTRLQHLSFNPLVDTYDKYLVEIEISVEEFLHSGFISDGGIHIDETILMQTAEKYETDPVELRKLWIEKICELIEKLDKNFVFFKVATELWDCYLDRLGEMKLYYSQQLFMILNKNNKTAIELNKQLNLQIDSLRQEHSSATLNAALSATFNTIRKIEDLCIEQNKEEEAFVDKIFKLLEGSNVTLLIDEIRRFLEQFIPPEENDPRVMKKRLSWMDLDELKTDNHLFPTKLLEIQYMIHHVNNWQFGIWSGLENLALTSQSSISELLAKWSALQKKWMQERMKTRLILNRIRMESIRSDFFYTRLAELYLHDERYQQHEVGIFEAIQSIQKFQEEFEAKLTGRVESEYRKLIERSEKALEDSKKKRHIVAVSSRFRYDESRILVEVQSELENFKKCFQEKLITLRNSHIGFMKSIRFFNEDGNFHVEEVKNLLKKISVLERNVLKEWESLKPIPSEMETMVISSCNLQSGEFMARLERILADYDFKEKVEQKVKKLHAKICNGIFAIKFEMKKLQAKMKVFMNTSESPDNLGKYEFLEVYRRGFGEILQDLVQFKDKLIDENKDEGNLYKPPINLSIISLNVMRAKRNWSLAIGNSFSKLDPKSKMKKLVATVVPNGCKNYSFVLFQREPKLNSSCLSKINCGIYESYLDIQKCGAQFYNERPEENDPSTRIIQPNYKRFCEEVLTKYKYYQLQCDFCWLDLMDEYTRLVTEFHRFLQNYYRASIKRYVETRREQLAEKFEEMMRKMADELNNLEKLYIEVRGKLKTSFGHQEAKQLLSSADDCMAQVEDLTINSVVAHVEPYKETIKSYCDNTEKVLIEIEDVLQGVKRDEVLEDLRSLLENELVRKVKLMEYELNDEPLSNASRRQSDVELVVQKRMSLYKKSLDIPTDIRISYSNIMEKTSNVKCEEGNIELGDLIKSNEVDNENYTAKIESVRTKCREIHFKYKMLWRLDIERITNLFRPKYDLPDVE